MKLVLAAVVAFLVAGCGFTNTKTQVETQTVTVTRTETHTVTSSTTQPSPAVSASACTATDLTGSFSVVPGSAGAGNIVYTLRVKNVGQDACSVSGIPQAQLIDASGKPLETSGTPNGTGAATKVVLQPGDSASAQARFSPDVDPCGNTQAVSLQVTFPGGGTFAARLDPPTRVCNHGAMQWSNFAAAG